MPAYEEDDRVGEVPAIKLRHFSAEERIQIGQLRDLEQEFVACLNRLVQQKGGNTRCLSLARTNIEQGVMWALREIVGDQPTA
jgi:hypothetical protein